MKRIHFVSLKINTVSGGGSHHTLDLKMRYLVERGYDITLTTLSSGGNALHEPPTYKMVSRDFEGSFLETQKHVETILRENEANTDLFHLDGQALIWGGGMYKHNGGLVPTIAFVNNYVAGMNLHHPDTQGKSFRETLALQVKSNFYALKRRIWERTIGTRYANSLDALLVDSPVVGKLYEKYGIKKEKIIVEPELIDTEKLIHEASIAESLPKENGTTYLLYVGRLTYDKGPDLLIESLKPIAKKERIHLTIIGEGPQKKYLADQTTLLGLENEIELLDWRRQEELGRYYKQADIFIHPTRWPEPFGRIIVEAMAFGKPILTTPGTGSTWVMGDAGTTFKKNNPSSLRDAILALKGNPQLLAEYGRKALERARVFDYKKTAPEFEKTLITLIEKKTPQNR